MGSTVPFQHQHIQPVPFILDACGHIQLAFFHQAHLICMSAPRPIPKAGRRVHTPRDGMANRGLLEVDLRLLNLAQPSARPLPLPRGPGGGRPEKLAMSDGFPGRRPSVSTSVGRLTTGGNMHSRPLISVMIPADMRLQPPKA